jgi:nitroreductase
MTIPSVMEQILDLARWAPSGDNNQPWRFEILSDQQVRVHCRDQSDEDVYDYNGQPTLLTLGFLLESMRIAATKFARSMEWRYLKGEGHAHLLEVSFANDASRQKDALLPYLTTRSVNRKRYRTGRLTVQQKAALQSALGDELEIRWFESIGERWRIARMSTIATHIRLSIPEAFTVHQRILDWDNNFSPNGVPAKAIGLDPMTLSSMKWVMQKWQRADFLNRFAAGTVVPRLEMDVLPGLLCSAHFMMFRTPGLAANDETAFLLRTGQALQRFWLTATYLGLVMQPSLAPLCFSYYGRTNRPFTADRSMRLQAHRLAATLEGICSQKNAEDLLFMGRIGRPISSETNARSVRRPLSSLLVVTK